MFSKSGTGKARAGRQQRGFDLVAGAFVGVMAVSTSAGAQHGPGGGGGVSQVRSGQKPGGMTVWVVDPVGPVQPGPVMDDERQRRIRAANGDRRLSPEEKWQLRQLIKAAQ